MNDLTPNTWGGARPGAGRPRLNTPPDYAALDFEPPAPPLTVGRAAKLVYHMIVHFTRRHAKMEEAIERILAKLDKLDAIERRLTRLETKHAHR
jgi:hypothetical protein